MPHRLSLTAAIAALACSALLVAAPAADAHPARHFKNCTAMHKVYPHGVGRTNARDHVSGRSKPVKNFKHSNALYAANKGSDRDHDGIACEAH